MKGKLFIVFVFVTALCHSQGGDEELPLWNYLYESANHYLAVDLVDSAIDDMEQAAAAYKEEFGSDDIGYYNFKESLSSFYRYKGDAKKSLKILLEIKIDLERLDQKDAVIYQTTLNTLANIYSNNGSFDKALSVLLPQLDAETDTISKIGDYRNLASIYKMMGDYRKENLMLKKETDLTKERFGENDMRYARVLDRLAYSNIGMGDHYRDFMALYKIALNIVEAHNKKAKWVGEMDLIFLAQLYGKTNDYQKARQLCYNYLNYLEKTNQHFKSNYEYGATLEVLVKSLQGSSSTDNLNRYLSLLEEYYINNSEDVSNYRDKLIKLAEYHEHIGNMDKYISLQNDVDEITLKNIKKSFAFQTQDEKEKYIENIVKTDLKEFSKFNYRMDLAYGQAIIAATNNILISKGLLLKASKDILKDLNSLHDEEITAKTIRFRDLSIFVRNELQLPKEKQVRTLSMLIEELNLLEREVVYLHSERFGAGKNFVENYKNTLLKDNEIAVEFTRFPERYNDYNSYGNLYAAYVYSNNLEEPKFINLIDEEQLTKLLTSSSNPNKLYKSRGAIAKSNRMELSSADSLYQLIWKPLEKHIDGKNKIYFSPDGLLHKIPFAALPDENGNLISEKYNIQQMGNTADVNALSSNPDIADVLLIGGVNYEYKIDASKKETDITFNILQSDQLLGNEVNRSITKNGFQFLPGTVKEIASIKKRLKNTRELTGYKATETAFKNLSGKSPSVLHIATHGYFLPKLEKRTATGGLDPKLEENPLLRSGLLFANANYAWQNGYNPYEEDDGILTALEISNLDLSTTDIVILSACETGLGDIVGSEGVYGLQRAFKMAGVKTIIMSLWEVPDEETAEFMNLFYKNWKKLNDPRKAFKKAQLKMMHKYRDDPQKWAAFVYFE